VMQLVKLTSLCRILNCLPGPGGLLQQDPYLVDGMAFVIEAMNEKEEMEQKRGSRNPRT